MTHRSGPAPPASHEISGRLHEQPQLAVHQLLSTDHEPGHPHKSCGTTATLNHRQGSLLLQTFNPQNGGALVDVDGFPDQLQELTTPHTSTRGAAMTALGLKHPCFSWAYCFLGHAADRAELEG